MSDEGARPFGQDLWFMDGPCLDIGGFHYPTRMVVIRLPGNRLMVWSPVAHSPEREAALRSLGTLRHLIAPNRLHHLALGDWQRAFPEALTHAAPGLRPRRTDLRFDADLTDTAHPDWADTVDQVVLRGNLIAEEVVFFHRPSRTVLITDMLQNFPARTITGWRALIARADGMVGPAPQVPRKFRLAQTGKAAGRAAVRQILDWPSDRLIVAHGTPLENGARAHLAGAFRWLTKEKPPAR